MNRSSLSSHHISRSTLLTIIMVLAAATLLVLQIWALWYYPVPAVYGQELEELETLRSFKLYGSGHYEDTTSELAAALGYNITEFQPFNNGTILVVTAAMIYTRG